MLLLLLASLTNVAREGHLQRFAKAAQVARRASIRGFAAPVTSMAEPPSAVSYHNSNSIAATQAWRGGRPGHHGSHRDATWKRSNRRAPCRRKRWHRLVRRGATAPNAAARQRGRRRLGRRAGGRMCCRMRRRRWRSASVARGRREHKRPGLQSNALGCRRRSWALQFGISPLRLGARRRRLPEEHGRTKRGDCAPTGRRVGTKAQWRWRGQQTGTSLLQRRCSGSNFLRRWPGSNYLLSFRRSNILLAKYTCASSELTCSELLIPSNACSSYGGAVSRRAYQNCVT